ncbi:MAG: TGBp1 family protein, partial [Clostridiales bacterium]|nr:TGBp1 family protein [Clostridiales bacterium]
VNLQTCQRNPLLIRGSLEKQNVIDDIKRRIETYFDEFIIDEIQDIAGRDFTFLEHLMNTSVDMLFVGDYYQHTYDTSRDGNVNKSLFNSKSSYEERFSQKGFIVDSTTLTKSWRCGPAICDYITQNLGIAISSNRQGDNSKISFVSSHTEVEELLRDPRIVKLHYQKSYQYGVGHRNWGDTKGEDCYQDVCVCLNKTTMKLYSKGQLNKLVAPTRNKLYVAITRTHGNCFLIEE